MAQVRQGTSRIGSADPRLDPRGREDPKGAEGPLNPKQVPVKDTARMSAHIKEVAKFCGPRMVGICELQPHHVYSNRGLRIDARKGRWGEPITLDHKYAISIAHEMDYERPRLSRRRT